MPPLNLDGIYARKLKAGVVKDRAVKSSGFGTGCLDTVFLEIVGQCSVGGVGVGLASVS